VVLIGAGTANREWINYEIIESAKRKNGLLGIYIHNVRDLNGQTTTKGANPFDYLSWDEGKGAKLSTTYPTYDWVSDNGRQNLSAWVEAAAKKVGR
jgi:hypothetical protein